MIQEYQIRVLPEQAASEQAIKRYLIEEKGMDTLNLTAVRVLKRSIDARQRTIYVNLTVRAYVNELPADDEYVTTDYPNVEGKPQAIVVGAGPGGLFAALRLIELGIRPVVVERGKNVHDRRKDIALISREQTVDPESNFSFGEGGAGAFSDGKLYTRSKKRGSVEKILNVFCQHGASTSILSDAHPHLGTDKLPSIIEAMRNTIIRCGGEVHFETRMDSLIISGDRVEGIVCGDKVFHGPVILATGHSARDVYHFLLDAGIDIEAKGIAVGVRLEHPQQLIDQIQYHSLQGRGNWLPAAEYSMLTRVDGRAVYSFCMCPGGFIIPAASAPGQLVVNGMSPSNRGTRWSNSGMVVEVLPEDVPGDDPLRVMRFQEAIESDFFADAQETQNAPAQRMTDFVAGRPSRDLPETSYAPGIHPARIDKLLPPSIAGRLREGFREFGRKSYLDAGKGRRLSFLTDRAVLIGCETRTSSPVRIPRDNETLAHCRIAGLYPCGEGAGYAGGIVSAAIDGARCAQALAATLNAKA